MSTPQANNNASTIVTQANNNDNVTAKDLQADVSSLARVSHRLAMIDNVEQFETVVGKLLPKLLTRMGRNHHLQQQLQNNQQQQQQDLKPWLEQIQTKLMEIFSHILKRTKERSSSNNNNIKNSMTADMLSLSSPSSNNNHTTARREPLPCLSILELLVQQRKEEEAKNNGDGSSNASYYYYRVQSDVDPLTKNLSLTFLTVGVPQCPDTAPLVPGLLLCLHYERQRQQQQQQQGRVATTSPAATTLTLLLLQSLVTLSTQPAAMTSSQDDDDDDDKLEPIRCFLYQRPECAAVLYELVLDVLLWTASPIMTATTTTTSGVPSSSSTTTTATSTSSLPPPGLSQQGQERLKQAISASLGTNKMMMMGAETKIALLELIAPARKAIFLGRKKKSKELDDDNNNNKNGTTTTRIPRDNLARTLVLLLVAKGVAATSERAQTYWQMYLQSNNHSKTLSSTSTTTSNTRERNQNSNNSSSIQQQQHKQRRQKRVDDGQALTLVVEDLILELLSLTLGQGQAEEILSKAKGKTEASTRGNTIMAIEQGTATTALSEEEEKEESKVISCALPLHCNFDNNNDNTVQTRDDDPSIWASKRRAVAFTPTATTIWTALALQVLPLVNNTPQSATTTTTFSIMVISQMVAFLAQKYLSSTSAHGPSSVMSIQQAKPYLALAQVLQAVTVQLCKTTTTTSATTTEETTNATTACATQDQVETLKAQFMQVVCHIFKRQVATASISSSSSSSSSFTTGSGIIMNSEGSWAVREECYSIICHLFRSSSSKATRTTTTNSLGIVSMETATLLFACAAKEHERLRPRAVAALDTLLEAFSRIYTKTKKKVQEQTDHNNSLKLDQESTRLGGEPMGAMDVEMVNPWSTTTVNSNTTNNNITTEITSSLGTNAVDDSTQDRTSLAKSLVPLLWNAAQPHQPKASRVAAARWATELLKKTELDLVKGCHLLCLLVGDPDVTAASIANQGLFDGEGELWHLDDDGLPSGLCTKTSNDKEDDDDDTAINSLPEFAIFVDMVFDEKLPVGTETRVQRYTEFSFLGKAAALRYGLHCLLVDIYGGDDAAVARYLLALMTTLELFADQSKSSVSGLDRTSVDLLEQCCVCLLATVKSSSFARRELTQPPPRTDGKGTSYPMTLVQVEELTTMASSSKARRHLAAVIGVLFEGQEAWSGLTGFSQWMSTTGVDGCLSKCVDQLSQVEKSHSQLGKLHGVIHLSGQILRAIRHCLLQFSDEAGIANQAWKDCTRILQLLGKGILHREEVISHASVDAVGIALSFDTLDAPPFDENLITGVTAVVMSISHAIALFCDGDAVDASRATGLVRAGGIVLGATSNVNNNAKSQDLHKSRQLCVDAILSVVGSMAFRKEEKIALAAGEALGEYADSCIYEGSDLSWPSEFQEDFVRKLPPQEYVLYFLTTNTLCASSPHRRTATAPALLGLVGRAARMVHLDGRNGNRSFVTTVRSLLPRLQGAFVSLLADPKIKHFSRESCCLGLAACRGLALFSDDSSCPDGSIDSLNHRLLCAFGQTANYGGRSAYQETQQQAAQRRAAEQGSETSDRNILEPFGMESEVGGAAGMGEAALGAYREMAAASIALGRPDVLYALLILSISHNSWFVGSTREKYNAAALLGESSIVGSRTNTTELRRALRPHLGKLLPRILRACNDPNKQAREQMSFLLTGLTGGGSETRAAVSEHFLSTIDILIQDASNKLWRARTGAIGALGEIIVGREWEEFGGGPPVLSDDDIYDDRHTKLSGVRLLRLWRVVVRALDDVRDTVRSNGERLGRALRGLTIRLCDPSIVEKPDGEHSFTAEAKARWTRDASAASATSIRWLVKHGLNQTVAESKGICISTLVELIAIAKPAIIEPSLPDLLRSLLMAMSGLEPAALNYLQLRSDNQEGLERARLQLAQTGPLAKAVTTCVDLLPNAKQAVQGQVVSELEAALRQSVGFATRAAVADTASMMCNTCPCAFSFPGAGNANPSVRLMRAFYFAAERERGQGAKDKMIHALGNLASLCPGGSVRSLAVRACKRYKSSTGNNDDPTSRRAAAAALRAIAVRASNQMMDGGTFDVWSQKVLPVAFLGQKDADSKTASLMKEVWEEGGVCVEGPVGYGTSREEQLLPGLVEECIGALQDVSWARRVAGSKALGELCDLGVLGPLPRAIGKTETPSRLELERSRRRAEACFKAIGECLRVVLKPRLWVGKSNVALTLAKVACTWTAIQSDVGEEFLLGWDGEQDSCPWMPLSMNMDGDSLFLGDDWFRFVAMDTEKEASVAEKTYGTLEPNEEGEKMHVDSETARSTGAGEADEQINFSEMEDEDDAGEDVGPAVVQVPGKKSHDVLIFTGLCRALLQESLPDKKMPGYELSPEYLPYRTACLEACRDLLKSLPSSDIGQKSLLYEKEGGRLVSCIRQRKTEIEPPVIVANAIDCLGQCFWEGFGSSERMTDDGDEAVANPTELCTLLRDVSGKQQPAWTVRRSGALGLAAFVSVCDARFLRSNYSSRVLDICMDCASYVCRDRKFWRVREAGLRLLGALIRRAGPSSAQREGLLLDALLPYKEDMLRLLRASLTDSEPAVTALSTELLSLMSWWH